MRSLQDIESALKGAGVPCVVENTGGNCYALYVRGSNNIELVTDGDCLSAYCQDYDDPSEGETLLGLVECQRGGVALIVETIKANLWRVGLSRVEDCDHEANDGRVSPDPEYIHFFEKHGYYPEDA